MSERARKLLHDAMVLPVSERAELAANLLASLDGEPEANVEAAWASEIERRAREALTNPHDDVAWETIRAGLHAAPTRRANRSGLLVKLAPSCTRRRDGTGIGAPRITRWLAS